MNEDKSAKREAIQKWVSIFVALLAVLVPAAFGLINYSFAAQRESQKPFFDKQLTLYFDASEAASKLATLPNGSERDEAKRKFWQLYWGQLSLVESQKVEAAMVKFGEALNRYEKKESGLLELQKLSLELSHACRDSLGDSWGVTQQKLTGQKK